MRTLSLPERPRNCTIEQRAIAPMSASPGTGKAVRSPAMAGSAVVDGAMTACSFGAAPATLGVLPTNRVLASGRPAATVMDHVAFVNIRPFGLCSSLANPSVAAATAAALGVLTPMPCAPLTPSPWLPGIRTTQIGGSPALGLTSTCRCSYGGVITVALAGQVTVQT